MGFIDAFDEEVGDLDRGLRLIGWRAYSALTSEDCLRLETISDKASEYANADQLTIERIHELSLEAYKILFFQLMNKTDRPYKITSLYLTSKNLNGTWPLIDEATLCFFRGYHTAALSLLFIILESYLRSLIGWKPGDKNPSFLELRNAIFQFKPSRSRDDAQAILDVIYKYYDSKNPPLFNLNRHGLLHGMRKKDKSDEMNCVRLYTLLDSLCDAEDRDSYSSLETMDKRGLKLRLSMCEKAERILEERVLLSGTYIHKEIETS